MAAQLIARRRDLVDGELVTVEGILHVVLQDLLGVENLPPLGPPRLDDVEDGEDDDDGKDDAADCDDGVEPDGVCDVHGIHFVFVLVSG